MAELKSHESAATPTVEGAPSIDMSSFADLIGRAVAQGIAVSMPKERRKVTFGEYARTAVNSFHPNKETEQKLRRVTFQNGGELAHPTLFDEEIALLNRITHSGRYLNRLVEVTVRDEGGGTETVYISYNSKRDGMDALRGEIVNLKGAKSVFQSLLTQVVEEQELEDLELQERTDKQTAARVARRK